ncbi:MAG: MFS transporter [Enterococcus sp.]
MTKKVKWYNYLAYGLVDFLGAGSSALTGAWLLFFYTTFCGLTATQGAVIFASARVVDAVVSPLMGIISDNFHKTALGKKFGRRKFFILLGIPLVLSYNLFWLSGQTFLYYLVTYITFDIVYTMVLVPYETLATEMTQDYKKRVIFSGSRLFCGQVAAFFAAFIPGRLIAWLGQSNASSFSIAAFIFSIIFVLILIGLYLFSWERPTIEEKETVHPKEKTKKSVVTAFKFIYTDLFSTFQIRAFRVHIIMYLGCYISQDIFAQVFTYFVVFALAYSAVTASNILSVITLFCIVGVALCIYTITKINPARIYQISSLFFLFSTLGFLAAYFVPSLHTIPFLFVVGAFCGVGRGALAYIPWNIYSFIPDVDELVTGRRREGAFAGVMTFTRKATQALAVFVVGLLLDHFGFISKATTQHPTAINTILAVMGIGVIVFLAMGIIASFQFKLTEESHTVLLNQITQYKENPNYVMDDQTAKQMKALTGWDKEFYWGNNNVGKVSTHDSHEEAHPV